MKLSVTRLDATLPLPAYQTAGSVAFDLYSRIDLTVQPKTVVLVPTNLIVGIPEGYGLFVVSRSSTPVKKGLLMPNGIGVVDQDYCGPKDELLSEFYNFTDAPVEIKRGERVAQALVMPIERCELVEVQIKEDGSSRGGVGSTG
jgi:dUTP pyrophosphatase